MSAKPSGGPEEKPAKLIGIVGPCAAGKSSLIAELTKRGFNARHIAQEHSYVPDMWLRLTHPDLLIFLDASYPVTCIRRNLNWTEAEWAEQQRRLSHARQHADLYLNTDNLNAGEVLKKVTDFITSKS
jgi:deoxyadenosine/deoxycytidine kinase